VFFAYPWPEEHALIQQLFDAVALKGAILVVYHTDQDIRVFRKVGSPPPPPEDTRSTDLQHLRKKNAAFHAPPRAGSPRTALPPAAPAIDGRAQEATSPAAAAKAKAKSLQSGSSALGPALGEGGPEPGGAAARLPDQGGGHAL